MTKHTEYTYKQTDTGQWFVMFGKNGCKGFIAQVISQEHAKFITKACNNYDKLVEMLEEIVDHWRMNDENYYKSELCTDMLALLSQLEDGE